jgi:DNA topoisomerase VI subunit A
VVEKDAVFQRLAEDRIFDTLPSIVITASTSTLWL